MKCWVSKRTRNQKAMDGPNKATNCFPTWVVIVVVVVVGTMKLVNHWRVRHSTRVGNRNKYPVMMIRAIRYLVLVVDVGTTIIIRIMMIPPRSTMSPVVVQRSGYQIILIQYVPTYSTTCATVATTRLVHIPTW